MRRREKTKIKIFTSPNEGEIQRLVNINTEELETFGSVVVNIGIKLCYVGADKYMFIGQIIYKEE